MRKSVITKEHQDTLTPSQVISELIEGNKRFVTKKKEDVDYLEQIKQTATGQFPKAVIHSCIDSRVPVEVIFDRSIGDVFSSRVAGNIINEDVLGSIEYACKVAGSKAVVVLGHTKCGAVTAACKHVKLGNITPLLDKIQPAVSLVEAKTSGSLNDMQIEEVTVLNVNLAIENIREKSPILAEMEQNGEIKMIGAIYDVATGVVDFFEEAE